MAPPRRALSLKSSGCPSSPSQSPDRSATCTQLWGAQGQRAQAEMAALTSFATGYSPLAQALAVALIAGAAAATWLPGVKAVLGLVAAEGVLRPWALITCAFVGDLASVSRRGRRRSPRPCRRLPPHSRAATPACRSLPALPPAVPGQRRGGALPGPHRGAAARPARAAQAAGRGHRLRIMRHGALLPLPLLSAGTAYQPLCSPAAQCRHISCCQGCCLPSPSAGGGGHCGLLRRRHSGQGRGRPCGRHAVSAPGRL